MRDPRNDDGSGSNGDYLDGENLPDDELCPLPPAGTGSQTSFFERGSLPEPGQTMTRTVEDAQSGWRLDLFLAHFYPQYSRVLIRRAIQAEGVDVSGRHGKPSYRLRPGEVVSFTLPELPRQSPIPEDIPLEVLYEDDVLAVINKPANMVVHPSRGHWAGTLVGALAYRYAGQLSTVRGPGRPGIVHRLDRDTSGVILVAKNDEIHALLASLFQERQIHKEYFAIVSGNMSADRDVVDQPIGHHPKSREKMMAAPFDPEAKEAVTYFEVVERFRGFSTVRALPRTGRTHQIRVHLAYKGTPVLCDRLYGNHRSLTRGEIAGVIGKPVVGTTPEQQRSMAETLLSRQALHARKLTFVHPITGKELVVEAPIPEDMTRTLEAIRTFRAE